MGLCLGLLIMFYNWYLILRGGSTVGDIASMAARVLCLVKILSCLICLVDRNLCWAKVLGCLTVSVSGVTCHRVQVV